MQTLILGAGAIGGYYVSHLARAGMKVSFLVRPGRAARLKTQGLTVWSQGVAQQQQVRTLVAAEVDQPLDLIILTCKAFDLPSAMNAIAPAVGPTSVVLPLLNGLAHMKVLTDRFGPERVLGGVAYIAAEMQRDGKIRRTSPSDAIIFGDLSGRMTPSVQALAAAFATTPVAARTSTEIVQDLWEKWCMLAAGAAVTCLMRGTIGEILATDNGAAVVASLIAETRAIAAGFDHPPRPVAVEQADRILRDPKSRWAASMMRDIAQGAPRLEAEHVIGDMIGRGRQVGVAAPLLAAAYAHLQLYNGRAAERAA